jgi:hypothetical protein
MPEIQEVYQNDSNFSAVEWKSNWIFLADVASITYTVNCSVNCDIGVNWSIDTNYEIILTDSGNVIGGSSKILTIPTKAKYAQFYVNNFNSVPCELQTQALFSETYTCDANGSSTDVSLISSGTTGSVSLVSNSMGPILGVKGFIGGTGISVIASSTDILINGYGITGDTGPIGPAGGPTGDTGATGWTGANGLQGLQGIQGNTGATGWTGATGLQGLQGIQGIQGIQGNTGANGLQGAIGATGNPALIRLFNTGTTGTLSMVGYSTGPNLTVKGLTGATGILISTNNTNITITNIAPDKTVTLTAGTGITISGSYPNFTIASSGSGGTKTITHTFIAGLYSIFASEAYSYVSFSNAVAICSHIPVNCTLKYIVLTPGSSAQGWTTIPANLSSGSIDYSIGKIPQATSMSSANFTAYSGAPHAQILNTDINTSATNWSSFSFSVNITITAGDRVSVRAINYMNNSASRPTFNPPHISLIYEY